MQINRLFEIIYVLLDKKSVTAAELAGKFEVSARTIYRDIETLCETGIPIYCERGRGGGIRLTDNFILNKSVLSDKEKRDILTALQTLSATGADDGSSLRKISSFLGGNVADWVAIDFSDWSERRRVTFDTLKTAVLQHIEITFDYYNTNGELSHRRVRPLQLWFKGAMWYLKAFCCEKQGLRVFKLSRIKRLAVTDTVFEPFEVEDNTTPQDWSQFRGERCELRISKKMAFKVYDDFDEEDITVLENGDFKVTPYFTMNEWVFGFILSYGPYAEVIAPAEFRQAVAEQYIKIAEIYKS